VETEFSRRLNLSGLPMSWITESPVLNDARDASIHMQGSQRTFTGKGLVIETWLLKLRTFSSEASQRRTAYANQTDAKQDEHRRSCR
jgi:hypothetical protein